jgi:transcriptional regulator with XRE-family HTH domain
LTVITVKNLICIVLRAGCRKLGCFAIGEGIDLPARVRTYSKLTDDVLQLLGKQIRLARKQRRMTETDLASRTGIARSTLQQIEKGDPRVEIGLVFEAATLAGVDLFVPHAPHAPGQATLSPQLARIDDKLALLPQSVRRPCGEVKDDF